MKFLKTLAMLLLVFILAEVAFILWNMPIL